MTMNNDPATATPAPPPLVQLATSFWVAQALYAAAELGIADRLHAGPRPVEWLANEAGADAGALRRVLRALASFGIFAEQPDGDFAMTAAAEPLRSGVPGSLRDFVVMLGAPESWRAWGEFLYSVRSGRSAFEHVYGMPVFGYFAEHPQAAARFDAAMTSRSAAEDRAVLAAYDLSGAHEVVDVGGGRGAWLAAALAQQPRLRGTLFDLPHVIAGAHAAGLLPLDRCRLVAGDFLAQPVPDGADLYVLKKVLHDWDDAQALRILQACRSAMSRPGARLLVIEPVIPPGNDPSFAKLLDLFMLVWPGGRERTVADHRALLASAGLALIRIVPTASPVSIIEAEVATSPPAPVSGS